MRRRNILFLEVDRRGFEVGLLDDHRIATLTGVEWNRVAPTALSYGLRVDRRGAIFADEPLISLVIADGAAYLASVEHRGDLAVRLLIEQEADLGATHLRRVPMQVAIGNLRLRNRGLAVKKSDLGRGGEGSGALGVDELGGNGSNEDEACRADSDHPETLATIAPLGFAL